MLSHTIFFQFYLLLNINQTFLINVSYLERPVHARAVLEETGAGNSPFTLMQSKEES